MTKEELRKWREDHGYTQEQLADALKVAPNSISRWELGTRSIPKYLELALQSLEKRKDEGHG